MRIGNTIIRLESADSTNEYAKRLISEKEVADGTVITSDYHLV